MRPVAAFTPTKNLAPPLISRRQDKSSLHVNVRNLCRMYTVYCETEHILFKILQFIGKFKCEYLFPSCKVHSRKKRNIMCKLFTAKLLIQFWKNISKELYTNYVDIIIYIRHA